MTHIEKVICYVYPQKNVSFVILVISAQKNIPWIKRAGMKKEQNEISKL